MHRIHLPPARGCDLIGSAVPASRLGCERDHDQWSHRLYPLVRCSPTSLKPQPRQSRLQIAQGAQIGVNDVAAGHA
jgi:hypothetical protein